MERALREARDAFDRDEVPVGALVVRGNQLLGRSGNRVEELCDATAHAEMLALNQAFATAEAKRLEGAEVFCTLEPCLQCAGALLHARVARVVFAASDPKFGGVVSLASLFDLPGINHRIQWQGGLLAESAAELMRAFFRQRR
ncbi:MAG: nucleoside deaminase [Planctomycetota bacterium]|nr:MAG: nucleoside deaminase [Planctomycetota bacterium]